MASVHRPNRRTTPVVSQQAPTRKRARRCSTCGAEPGHPCKRIIRGAGYTVNLAHHHKER